MFSVKCLSANTEFPADEFDGKISDLSLHVLFGKTQSMSKRESLTYRNPLKPLNNTTYDRRQHGTPAILNLACVAWRFWLGELSNKGGRGQRNREEILAGSTPLLRPARQNRHATQAILNQ